MKPLITKYTNDAADQFAAAMKDQDRGHIVCRASLDGKHAGIFRGGQLLFSLCGPGLVDFGKAMIEMGERIEAGEFLAKGGGSHHG